MRSPADIPGPDDDELDSRSNPGQTVTGREAAEGELRMGPSAASACFGRFPCKVMIRIWVS